MRGRLTGVVVGLVLTCQPLQAQADWREELKSDLVTERDGKFVVQEVGIYEVRLEGYEPSAMQVKFYSEAPADGTISRDNFVAVTSTYGTLIVLSSFAEAYQVSATQLLENFDYRELQAPIGTPDMEVNLFMTGEGMQVEIVNTATGERSRIVQTWEELYGSASK